MALFLSTYTNKVDAKGRVSVPAGFRAALSEQAFHGVIVFKSNRYDCLEAVPWSVMQELSDRLGDFDFLSSEQDDLSTLLFGESVQLAFDGEGRVILPKDMLDYAGVDGQLSFVGLGQKFQLWSPDKLEARKLEARASVKDKKLTVPKKGADR